MFASDAFIQDSRFQFNLKTNKTNVIYKKENDILQGWYLGDIDGKGLEWSVHIYNTNPINTKQHTPTKYVPNWQTKNGVKSSQMRFNATHFYMNKHFNAYEHVRF